MPMQEDDLLLIGKVVRTHGIKGEIRVLPYTESVDSFRAAGEVYFKLKGGPLHSFYIKSVRPHKNIYIVALEGIENINEAELWVGAYVYRRKSTLPPPDRTEDEYYWYEVIGLEVRTQEGRILGEITQVFNAGSNDVFVVYNKEEKKEYLIPSIADVIVRFDWENRILWINLIPGLE